MPRASTALAIASTSPPSAVQPSALTGICSGDIHGMIISWMPYFPARSMAAPILPRMEARSKCPVGAVRPYCCMSGFMTAGSLPSGLNSIVL
jgi:hypothetical protein